MGKFFFKEKFLRPKKRPFIRAFSNLRSLTLRNNQLTSYKVGAFAKLYRMNFIDLKFNNLSQTSEIKKSDLINNSSAIASIEFDENVTTVATLKMLNPTWLQLRDESNNIVFSKLMDKDEEFSYALKLNYNITAGNAGNILVLIDDEVRGKIGKYGDILDSFVLYKDFTN